MPRDDPNLAFVPCKASPGDWHTAATVRVGQLPYCPLLWASPPDQRCSWVPREGSGFLQAMHEPVGLGVTAKGGQEGR